MTCMAVRHVASVVFLFVFSNAALAQQKSDKPEQFEGVDLSDDAKQAPKDKAPAEGAPQPDASALPKNDAKSDLPPVTPTDSPRVERDITQDDRVKAVQRKLYIKRGRFELAPYFVFNVNDAFYNKFGGAIRAAFYPADSFALSARFTLMRTLSTDDVRTAKQILQSQIYFSVPYWMATANAEFSPFYGKVAFANSILHLDGYVTVGGGVVYTATTGTKDASLPGNVNRGINPAFDLGFGLRFIVKDFFAINLGLENTTYIDQPTGTTKGITQNVMLLQAGVSFFLPFKSTFREAE